MFRTTLATTLLAVTLNVSAVELTNNTISPSCDGDIACLLREADIQYIMRADVSESGVDRHVIMLVKPEVDRARFCEIARRIQTPVFLIKGDTLERC